uniref:Kinesin motor domain-containing protein n=1 Tax=Nelumbo nucifera TaxID=4432 RepID=A0A822ZJV9_NELNU|nr:TPA_asm: hypothetical protein HUJ06_000248 [Nelumbo nucifera]
MESRRSGQSLAKSINSLLGLKTHLTSSWADSVCNIIKDLPSEEPHKGSQTKYPDYNTKSSFESNDAEVGTTNELSVLNTHLSQLNLQRRHALNEILDIKGNIRVFCRIRPIITEEKSGYLGHVVASDSSNVVLKLDNNKNKSYSFDKVFHQGSSQDEVFSEIEPVIKSVIDGYNVCIFAYRQTGTGKSFTMEGKPDSPGVVPRAIEALFKQGFVSPSDEQINRPHYKMSFNPNRSKRGVKINNLVAIKRSNINQAIRLYKLGSQFRSTASTNSNLTSSRSHCLIRISLTCSNAPERRREMNKIWMVDLGGSERVLKTKAWGRRLEEGKAINLSLSALGDVISALQRRKSHIPYRNSKLTQVLRDSLGEDSKTLMLVHVSPKEEDLCETVCSLGFATRARSIHLGMEESNEIQAKKEIEMTTLLQKVNELEYEGQAIKRNIKKLEERLEHLIRTTSYDENLEALHLYNELPLSNMDMDKHNNRDVIADPSTKLPRFMRPTVCSRRKSGTDNQTSKILWKKHALPGRKRSSSVYAETIARSISEYSSICSTSKTSCLLNLDMNSGDTETEYSQDASECDIKMVVFPEQEEPPMNLSRSTTGHIHKSNVEYANRKENRTDSKRGLTMKNWIHVQKNKPTTSTYIHQGKQVIAIPIPEKKSRCDGQNKGETLQHEKGCNHNFLKKKFLKNDSIKKLDNSGAAGKTTIGVVVDETPSKLDDFVIDDSSCNPTSTSYITDNKVMEETWDSKDGFTKKDECIPTLAAVVYDRLNQGEDYRVYGTSIKQVDGHNSSKDSMCKDSQCNYSPFKMWNNMIHLKEESHDQVLYSKLEPEIQRQPNETCNDALACPGWREEKIQTEAISSDDRMKSEDNENGNSCASPQYMETNTRHFLSTMRSQRALFRDPSLADQNLARISFGSSEKIHMLGIYHLLRQKIQIICAGALLGLGVQNLGLNDDFFYGLTL